MAGIKIVNLPALGRNLASTDLFELSLAGGTGSRKITGQEIINAIPSGLTVGTTTIASGAVGKLLFETTGNVLGETSLFNIDPSNGYLGVGTTTPYFPIDLKFNTLGFYSGPTYYAYLGLNNGSFYLTSYSDFVFGTSVVGNPLTIKQNGNVLINTGTDAGYKLDVNGTARVSGDLRLSANIYISRSYAIETGAAFPSYSFNGNSGSGMFQAAANIIGFSTANTERMRIDATGNVGIGTSSPAFKADIIGTGRINNLTIGDGTYRATSITFASLAGGAEKKGIFFDGGAKIYFQQTPLLALESPYNGGTLALSFDGNTNNVNFYNQSGTILSKIFANTGNWGINTTTDAGYKLDVNGTARVSALYVPRDPSYGTRTFLYNADGVDLMQTVSNDQLRITRSTYFSSWISVNEIQTSAGQLNLSSAINISGSNTGGVIRNTATWAVQSGSTACGIYFAPIIDTDASSSNETIKGFYYNPNIADIQSAKHYAIHTTSGRVRLEGLPTSPAGLSAGDLYNNLGVLMIV